MVAAWPARPSSAQKKRGESQLKARHQRTSLLPPLLPPPLVHKKAVGGRLGVGRETGGAPRSRRHAFFDAAWTARVGSRQPPLSAGRRPYSGPLGRRRGSADSGVPRLMLFGRPAQDGCLGALQAPPPHSCEGVNGVSSGD